MNNLDVSLMFCPVCGRKTFNTVKSLGQSLCGECRESRDKQIIYKYTPYFCTGFYSTGKKHSNIYGITRVINDYQPKTHDSF